MQKVSQNDHKGNHFFKDKAEGTYPHVRGMTFECFLIKKINQGFLLIFC